MPDREALKDLIERVEKATGPDREIDAAIAMTLLGSYIKREPGRRSWRHAAVHAGPYTNLPAYTASIDAALSLVERVRPGWGCQVGRPIQTYTTGFYASVFRERLPTDNGWQEGHSSDWGGELNHIRPRDSYRPNGALAILAALLRSLKDAS